MKRKITGFIAYAGHPLYRYVLNRKPGQTKGEGLQDFGAGWDMLSPAGKKIESDDRRATSPKGAFANDDPSPITAKRGSAPSRELAQRMSGRDEVLLLWHPESDRVELSVNDVTTGAGFHIEVAPGIAMDAFRHPYAYAARGESACLFTGETEIADG